MWVCRISFRVSVYPEITIFLNVFFFFCCLFCILDTVPDLSSKFLITALVLTSVWVGCFHLFSCKLQNCRNCSNFLHYPEQYTHQKCILVYQEHEIISTVHVKQVTFSVWLSIHIHSVSIHGQCNWVRLQKKKKKWNMKMYLWTLPDADVKTMLL